MQVVIAKLPFLAILAVLLFKAACSGDSPKATPSLPVSGETHSESTEAEPVAAAEDEPVAFAEDERLPVYQR